MTTVRDSAADRGPFVVIGLMMTVIASTGVSAHRSDEYLQAARLGVDPSRVELELANALVPESDRIAVTAQHRDGDQCELTIELSGSNQRLRGEICRPLAAPLWCSCRLKRALRHRSES